MPPTKMQCWRITHIYELREVFGEEKNRLWAVAEQYWPHFPEYRAQAGTRDIPVLVLEPRNNGEG
jgi:hypothetical protein